MTWTVRGQLEILHANPIADEASRQSQPKSPKYQQLFTAGPAVHHFTPIQPTAGIYPDDNTAAANEALAKQVCLLMACLLSCDANCSSRPMRSAGEDWTSSAAATTTRNSAKNQYCHCKK